MHSFHKADNLLNYFALSVPCRGREVRLILTIEAPQSFLHCPASLIQLDEHRTKGVQECIGVEIDFARGRKKGSAVVDPLPHLHVQVAKRVHLGPNVIKLFFFVAD